MHTAAFLVLRHTFLVLSSFGIYGNSLPSVTHNYKWQLLFFMHSASEIKMHLTVKGIQAG